MPRIVSLNVFTDKAPTPNNFQQMGAFISQGATTLSTGSYSLLTQDADLIPLLAAALSLTSLTWSGGTVTATASAAIPGLTTNDTFITTIAGATPAGYNGTYSAIVTGTNTFTFTLASNPGTESVAGTYTPPNQQELIAMVDEFYVQGQSQAVYVLELGAGDGTSGPTALSSWIQSNPGVFSNYLLPRLWDASSQGSPTITLMKAYESTTSLTYFWVTTTTSNYAQYTGMNAIKSAVPFVEAPGANATLMTFRLRLTLSDVACEQSQCRRPDDDDVLALQLWHYGVAGSGQHRHACRNGCREGQLHHDRRSRRNRDQLSGERLYGRRNSNAVVVRSG